MNRLEQLELLARYVRNKSFQVILDAGSGHLGACSSSAELMIALYFGGILKYDPSYPRHHGRDRVLVRGHLGPLRYSIFNLLGWVEDNELKTYRKIHSRLQGHESMDCLPGIDITPSGMLGMGLSFGVGAAFALRQQRIPATIWSFLGDGEEQEGNISEAARHAANSGLDNLVCILDRNRKQLTQQITDVDGASDVKKIWEGYGWQVEEIGDGNSMAQVLGVLGKPCLLGRPTIYIAHTVKGKGLYGSEDHPNGYHTISSCPPLILTDTIASETEALSNYDVKAIATEMLLQVARPKSIPELKRGSLPKLCLPNTDVPEDGLVEYLNHMTHQLDGQSTRFYVLTGDVTRKELAEACGFNESHVVFIDAGIREQHLLAMAHGISVTDPDSLLMIMESDAFLFRAADQIYAISQGKSRVIIFGGDSGVCGARNGSTHQTVGQPAAIIHMPGITFLEPADALDLELCLNWAIDHDGPVFIRFHDGVVKPLQVCSLNRNLAAYTAYEPQVSPCLVIVASGLPVGEAVALAKEKERKGVGIRVVNVISPLARPEELSSRMLSDIPVLTVYNGHPAILQSAVAKAVMEGTHQRPSAVIGHGYYLGVSGSREELLEHFRLDSRGIATVIQEKFPGVL